MTRLATYVSHDPEVKDAIFDLVNALERAENEQAETLAWECATDRINMRIIRNKELIRKEEVKKELEKI